MTGILPTTAAGGVPTGTDPNAVPGTLENVYVPAAPFSFSCPQTALPSDCTARIEPRQINALVSELVCFAEKLNPDGIWTCGSLCNLAAAFTGFLEGSHEDSFQSTMERILCELPAGDVDGTANPAHTAVFCDGAGNNYRAGLVSIATALCANPLARAELVQCIDTNTFGTITMPNPGEFLWTGEDGTTQTWNADTFGDLTETAPGRYVWTSADGADTFNIRTVSADTGNLIVFGNDGGALLTPGLIAQGICDTPGARTILEGCLSDNDTNVTGNVFSIDGDDLVSTVTEDGTDHEATITLLPALSCEITTTTGPVGDRWVSDFINQSHQFSDGAIVNFTSTCDKSVIASNASSADVSFSAVIASNGSTSAANRSFVAAANNSENSGANGAVIGGAVNINSAGNGLILGGVLNGNDASGATMLGSGQSSIAVGSNTSNITASFQSTIDGAINAVVLGSNNVSINNATSGAAAAANFSPFAIGCVLGDIDGPTAGALGSGSFTLRGEKANSMFSNNIDVDVDARAGALNSEDIDIVQSGSANADQGRNGTVLSSRNSAMDLETCQSMLSSSGIRVPAEPFTTQGGVGIGAITAATALTSDRTWRIDSATGDIDIAGALTGGFVFPGFGEKAIGEIDAGLAVMFEGEAGVRLANKGEKPDGFTTNKLAVCAGGGFNPENLPFVLDEWGHVIHDEVERDREIPALKAQPEIKDDDGNVLMEAVPAQKKKTVKELVKIRRRNPGYVEEDVSVTCVEMIGRTWANNPEKLKVGDYMGAENKSVNVDLGHRVLALRGDKALVLVK